MSEEEFKKLKQLCNECNECSFPTCEQCEISYSDIQAIKVLLDKYNNQKEEIERFKNAEEYAKLGKETLLDTIHKQKEEIEELKEINHSLLWQRNNIDIPKLEDFYKNYISKDKLREIVRWIIVIEDPRSNNYRPIKNTSAQDVYEAFYKIKKLVEE